MAAPPPGDLAWSFPSTLHMRSRFHATMRAFFVLRQGQQSSPAGTFCLPRRLHAPPPGGEPGVTMESGVAHARTAANWIFPPAIPGLTSY
ncbi:MAG TPA: hypothetical protein VF933_19950 [Streptosporangiaceae bacterium]